jgi:hypothetical protein
MKKPKPIEKSTQHTFQMELTRRPSTNQSPNYSNINVQKQSNTVRNEPASSQIKSPTAFRQTQQQQQQLPISPTQSQRPSKIPLLNQSSPVARSSSSSSSRGNPNHQQQQHHHPQRTDSNRRQRSADYRYQYPQHRNDDEYTSGEFEGRSLTKGPSRNNSTRSTDSTNRITIKINQKK